jgi:hypothetical protein
LVGANLSMVSWHSFSTVWRKFWLLASRPCNSWVDPGPHIISSRFPDIASICCFTLWCCCWLSTLSSDVIAPLCLGSLFHCCFPGTPVISSQAFVLQGLLLQHCPGLVPDDHVPYAVQVILW